jgi:polyphosphate:AMP phosphotransferase
MLEKIDLTRSISKEESKKQIEPLQEKLGSLQRECREKGIPVIIVFEGLGASGKGTQINRLIQAMDPRGFNVYTSNRSTEEEELRPFLWRYWVKTPEKGRIAIFDRSWYRSVQADRFAKEIKKDDLNFSYQDINSFEKQLTDDGNVIIKFFLYIDKKEQKERFKRLENAKETAWRVTKEDWARNEHFDQYVKINDEMLEATDTDNSSWTLVEAMDKNYAALKIISTVCNRLEDVVESLGDGKKPKAKGKSETKAFGNDVLGGVDLSLDLKKKDYETQIDALQERLEELHNEIYRRRIPVVIGFEGWDAGGKGGAIKRLTSHLDPRGYQVHPTSAPNDIEKAHHYLWRFWNHVPKAGHISIFDRTWYGRVMVERVEGFCSQEEWMRAYREINEMERHLANFGTVVLKFWLQIDKDEQERRFKDRQENPAKQWKITDEDWRNREKWEQYEVAVNEMLVRTSTTYAPWTVVEGNSKLYARVKVLKTVVEALESRL